jgi:hypothetical protein
LKGSTAIYAVTDFFEPFAASGTDPEVAIKVEFIQGKNLANAANKTTTLEHSSQCLEDLQRKVSRAAL